MWFVQFLVCFAFLLLLHFKKRYEYWSKRNVTTIKPKIPFGNIQNVFIQSQSFGVQLKKLYNEFKAQKKKFGGVYIFDNPALLIVDPEIVRLVLLKDFNHFADRSNFINEERDPLTGNLLFLKGNKWKNMRSKLTPAFSPGKIKLMFPIFQKYSKKMLSILSGEMRKGYPVEMGELMTRYTTDIIGSCAFGLDCNCLENPNSEFRKYTKKIFESSFSGILRDAVAPFFPKLFNFFGIRVFKKEVERFYVNLVKDTVEFREKERVVRSDLLQLLIQLKNEGFVGEGDSFQGKQYLSDGDKQKFLTIEQVAAQALVFVSAGFETSSTTIAFCLYELAINLEIQEKLREEVLAVLRNHGGMLTYEALNNMTFLDKCVSETLRKYPPAPIISRECTIPYQIPGESKVVIEKGTKIYVSIMGLHMDPQYYPTPEIFDPERFTEENISKRPNFTWMPFGEGPKTCIGLRLGLLQVKSALASVLSEFRFSINPTTATPLQFQIRGIVLRPKGGVWLNVEELDNK